MESIEKDPPESSVRSLMLALPFTHKLALPTIVTFECEAVTHQL